MTFDARPAATHASSKLPDQPSQRPRASVVIPRSRSTEPIEACLDALAGGTVTEYETIVIDSSELAVKRGPATDGGSDTEVQATRVVHPERPLQPHEARNRGVALARGEIIVFTDGDCIPRPDWLERLLERHASGTPLIGGSIDPDGGGVVERGADICKFASWLEGLPPGERYTLPTANLSLTRETWERIGPFQLLAWSGDTEFCMRARAAGIPLQFEPRAVVRHDDRVDLRRFLHERRERGAAYASLRAESDSWSRARCAAYVVLSPIIGLKLTARGFAAAIRSGRAMTALLTLPITSVGFAMWTLGEAGAYLRRAVSGSHEPAAPVDL